MYGAFEPSLSPRQERWARLKMWVHMKVVWPLWARRQWRKRLDAELQSMVSAKNTR